VSARRRVLLIQPSLQPPGGGNGVAAWMLEALRGRHHIDLITVAPVDLPAMNRFYGTAVQRADLGTIRRPHRAQTAWTSVLPFSLAYLQRAILLRHAWQVASGYDVLVTANNEADFGCRGIQYVHYPCFKLPRPTQDIYWYNSSPALVGAYYRLAERVCPTSHPRMTANLTLVNSDWTGRLVAQVHGISARTLYPPVTVPRSDVPWDRRIEGFLCIGRIDQEKELDRVIDIVAGVRRRFPSVSLCIVGTPGSRRYVEHIRARAAAAGAWVTIRENLSREELLALIPTYRYGIHGMLEEHFGMAPAEMASAGCIVFVPNAGGRWRSWPATRGSSTTASNARWPPSAASWSIQRSRRRSGRCWPPGRRRSRRSASCASSGRSSTTSRPMRVRLGGERPRILGPEGMFVAGIQEAS